MPAVAAAQRERTIPEIGKLRNGSTGHGDDLAHPAQIGVAHRNRAATPLAPCIGLDEGEVRIPSDIDPRQRRAGRCEKGGHLHLVALKQHHLDVEMRFLVKVMPHALPDRNHLRIICDGTYPDRPAHVASRSTLEIQMRSEQRYSQNGLADEVAQNIARRRHHCARMGIAEQSLDGRQGAWKTRRRHTPASPPT